MNLRDRLTEDLRRVEGRIDNWLDRFFPEFQTVFNDWDGNTIKVPVPLIAQPFYGLGTNADLAYLPTSAFAAYLCLSAAPER